MRAWIAVLAVISVSCFADPMAAKAVPPKAAVSFVSPKDGATVGSPVKVVMMVTGLKVRKAGEDPNDKTTGHHHLIIDGGPMPAGQVIATDATHLHFGKGQTFADVSLTPGPHTLTLQFADGAHRSYGPDASSTIHITVK